MMKYSLWLSLVLLGCLWTVYAEEETCDGEVDENVYSFGFGYSDVPYEYLNDDGELVGFSYDITRSICKVMKKKCVYSVYYDYGYGYNDKGISIALNDGWYDGLASWVQTPKRLSSYAFSEAYAEESRAYLYVRTTSRLDSIDEIKRNANKFGFRTGFKSSPECLENYLGMSLSGKEVMYDDGAVMEAGLQGGEVDVVFMVEIAVQNKDQVRRVGSEPIRCASGGVSVMIRKDTASQLDWFNQGLAKLRDNGDYQWLCNINYNDIDVPCFE